MRERRRRRLALSCLVAFVGLAGCTSAPADEARPTATLRPWRTPTASPSPAAAAPTQQATIPPEPTPTPLTHIVQAGDTLRGIAFQYGVSPDALLALNPGIIPDLLSIGQALLIPGPEGEPITSLGATATPIPLTFSPVSCYPTATAGLMCLTAVHNPTEITLEGLTAQIDLLDESGEVLAGATGFSPLNLVPPGGTAPIGVYFAPPAPEAASARASGLTAFPANEVDRRYLDISLRKGDEVRSQGGVSWLVSGEVVIRPDETAEAAKVQVLVTAFDAQGQVVGYAVWEAGETPGPGDSVAFRVSVVSLSRPIARVEIQAEALVGAEGAS